MGRQLRVQIPLPSCVSLNKFLNLSSLRNNARIHQTPLLNLSLHISKMRIRVLEWGVIALAIDKLCFLNSKNENLILILHIFRFSSDKQ